MSKAITVLVTGVGGGALGEQILKALRLATTPYRTVGTDISPLSKGLGEVDQPYLLVPASDPTYMPCVEALCRKHRIQAIFPGSEAELQAISRHRDRLQRTGVFLPINPRHVIEKCMDKTKTMRALSDLGFHTPRSVTIHAESDVRAIPFLPAVLKPSLGAGGSANTFVAQTPEELNAFCRYLLTIYPEFIVQEYVGTPDQEYTVGVLLSMEGEFINSIAVRRIILGALSNKIKIPNRTGNKSLGPVLAISSGISQGEIGRFPQVTVPCEKLALALGCRGAVNIQCRLVEGKVYVFEINARFSGTTSLRALVGYNEPDVLIRKHLLNQTIKPRFKYREGFVMRGLEELYLNRRAFPSAKDLL